MTGDITKGLVEDDAHEPDGEATFGRLSRGDIAGVLTTSQEHMELLKLSAIKERADGCGSAGLYELKDASGLESLGVKELGLAVSRACDEHGVIVGVGKGEDLALMNVFLSYNLIALQVVDKEAALISRNIDRLVKLSPRSLSDQVVLRALNSLFTLGVLPL